MSPTYADSRGLHSGTARPAPAPGPGAARAGLSVGALPSPAFTAYPVGVDPKELSRRITSAAVSLNVPDVEASAGFARDHLGFTDPMSADGFVSLAQPSAGFNLIFLRTGLETSRPPQIAGPAGQGMPLVFVVEDLDAEFARIAAGGARVVTEPETEPWGERFCQFADGNGLVWQLVQWVAPPHP